MPSIKRSPKELYVHSITNWLRPRIPPPPPPIWGRHRSVKIDDISLWPLLRLPIKIIIVESWLSWIAFCPGSAVCRPTCWVSHSWLGSCPLSSIQTRLAYLSFGSCTVSSIQTYLWLGSSLGSVIGWPTSLCSIKVANHHSWSLEESLLLFMTTSWGIQSPSLEITRVSYCLWLPLEVSNYHCWR